MTVRELMEALSKFDGDLPVYLPYAEGGVDDVEAVEAATVERGYRQRRGLTYYGDHGEPDPEDFEAGERTAGVKIL